MKIESVHLSVVRVPIRRMYISSTGVKRDYQKTILRLKTSDGLAGIGETDGSRAIFSRTCELASRLIGEDLSTIQFGIGNHKFHTFSFAPLLDRFAIGGIEMAYLDLLGKQYDKPVCKLLDDQYRTEVDMVCELSAASLEWDATDDTIKAFFRNKENIECLVRNARKEVQAAGYMTIKQKTIGQDPSWDVQLISALREEFGSCINIRHDPNGAYSLHDAIELCSRMEPYDLQWFEDPTAELDNMRELRNHTQTKLATNMCVTNFSQLQQLLQKPGLDIIGIDPFHWAGLANARQAISICQSNNIDFFLHCCFDLGITTAAMLQLAASVPLLQNGLDTCIYLQGTDIIKEGEFQIIDGFAQIPTNPGLGVSINEDCIKRYSIQNFDEHL